MGGSIREFSIGKENVMLAFSLPNGPTIPANGPTIPAQADRARAMGGETMRTRLVLAVAVVALIVGCGQQAAPSAQSSAAPRVMRLMLSNEPTPYAATERRELLKETMDSNVLEPLFRLDPSGKPVPALALSAESRDSTKTWRVQLRQGVKFQNGDSFGAKDVVETAKWMLAYQKDTGTSGIYSYVPITDAVQVDDYTVDLKFASPQPLFLIQQIWLDIYPASIASDPAQRLQAKRIPVGTGPYKFVKWDAGQSIALERFEAYWGPKPQASRVEITWRKEPGVRLAALLAGEVDWAYDLPLEEADRAPQKVLLTTPDRYEFRLDSAVQKNPIMADKRIRLALDYALDRQALVNLFAGQAVILQGQLALPGEFGYNPNIKPRAYDLEKAKSLIAEANAVGKTVQMTCGEAKRPKQREICQASAAMFEKAGLKVNLVLLAAGEDTKYTQTQGPERGIRVSDIHQQAPDFILESEGRFGKSFDKGASQVAYEDQAAWDLYSAVKAETNLEKRAEKLGLAWAYLYEQGYYIPLVVPSVVLGFAKNIERSSNITGWPVVSELKFKN